LPVIREIRAGLPGSDSAVGVIRVRQWRRKDLRLAHQEIGIRAEDVCSGIYVSGNRVELRPEFGETHLHRMRAARVRELITELHVVLNQEARYQNAIRNG